MAESVEKVRFPPTAEIALRGKEVPHDAANVPQCQCKASWSTWGADYEVPHVFLRRSRRSTYKISQTFSGDFFNRKRSYRMASSGCSGAAV